MKTPLQQLIEKLEHRISIKTNSNDELSDAFEQCVKIGMKQAIEDAKELLIEEKMHISKAVYTSCNSMSHSDMTCADEYYFNTYEKTNP